MSDIAARTQADIDATAPPRRESSPPRRESSRAIIDEFSRLYYQARTYSKISWHGVPLLKYPTDLLMYQEIIWRVRPTLIIETGTFMGGSALFFAEQLDAIGGDGRVITIDNYDWSGADGYPRHERIDYVRGSSTEVAVSRMSPDSPAARAVMVVLDSCHDFEHVLHELQAYAPLVTPGSYLVVEDTNVPQVAPERTGTHPLDALNVWLPHHPEFVVDRDCERFLLTAAPGGWLRRV